MPPRGWSTLSVREDVRRKLEDLASALGSSNPGDVVAHLLKAYEGQGLTDESVRSLCRDFTDTSVKLEKLLTDISVKLDKHLTDLSVRLSKLLTEVSVRGGRRLTDVSVKPGKDLTDISVSKQVTETPAGFGTLIAERLKPYLMGRKPIIAMVVELARGRRASVPEAELSRAGLVARQVAEASGGALVYTGSSVTLSPLLRAVLEACGCAEEFARELES